MPNVGIEPPADADSGTGRSRAAGVALALLLGLHHLLVGLVLPVIPNNDSVSYVEFGRVSDARRPIDHYAPPDPIPGVGEIPSVDLWRSQQNPAYGYPWIYLDLPEDWLRNPAWLLAAYPPLADRLVPVNREWDNSFPIGASFYFDLVSLLVPPAGRAAALVLLNHVFVVGTALFLWRIGGVLGWPRVGWAAALVYGTQLAPAARAHEVMTEPLFTFVDSAALLLLLRGAREERWGRLAAGGALLGVAFAVRSVAALQPLVVALCLAGWARSKGDWLARNLAWGAAFAAVVGLVLLHNWYFFGRLAYTTSAGRHLFNRVAVVDRLLDPDDDATKLVLDLARRPRLGGPVPHPDQDFDINVYTDSSCWALYWMLRWQGLDVEQADGFLRRAALAGIRLDPAGYLRRSLAGVFRLGVGRSLPAPAQLVDANLYGQYMMTWFLPQIRLAPYNWIGAQWRVFKREIPLYGPPGVLPDGAVNWLVRAWATVPDIRPAAFFLAFVAAGAAWAGGSPWGWMLVLGWYLATTVLPAFVQVPNPRYGEPSMPCGALLACFALGELARLAVATARRLVAARS